jgi:hypothetical protein
MPAAVFVALAAALAGLCACEQSVSAEKPPVAPAATNPASSSNAPPAPPVAEERPVAATFHALTIAACVSHPSACSTSEMAASPDSVYRVAFGSGHGTLRSREQATADLYTALRDRMGAGERLDAEPHVSGDAGAGSIDGASIARAGADCSDSLAKCALHLLELVDTVGTVTVDVNHGRGQSTGCVLSLGPLVAGAGSSECLVRDAEHPRGRGRGGLQF